MLVASIETSSNAQSYARLKRLIDLICAVTGFAFLLPLFVIVAIAIRMDSKGPVLFRQLRGGRDGAPFRIYKFRTMDVLEDGPEVRQATYRDPRVTRVGRWLRLSSVDELPQLLNVIVGHMSLVGPRPHAVAHDAYYSRVIENYAGRYRVRPGITGLAQVSGSRGETPSVRDMRRRVELDNIYVARQSLSLDAWILLRTFIHIVEQQRA
jgi:lipopolysaccharide/colanic/teichoic acid biosynthesis glycosyltransferase